MLGKYALWLGYQRAASCDLTITDVVARSGTPVGVE